MEENDIVVANVDDQFTLKYFQKVDGKICLVPGTKKYKTIYPNASLTIQGVVISTVRRYR